MSYIVPDTPIVIAGGGIGGLATAVGLANLNYIVSVFEQAADFKEVGAGVQLAPNGVRALGKLGLHQKVETLGWRPGALVMRDAVTAATVTRIPLTEGFVARFHERYTVMHRADLLAVLLEACEAHPNITLTTGSRVESFETTGRGVDVTLGDGGVVHGAGLIGADGLHSVVRKQIIGDGDPKPPRLVVYRTVVPRAQIPDDLWSPDVVMWSGAGADLVHYPLRSGELFNLVATFQPAEPLDPADVGGSPTNLQTPYLGHDPSVRRLIDLIDAERRWLVTDREPTRGWSRGPVTLLGDAAHPMLQYVAQGACQALEDAIALVDEVERSPADLALAFRRYADGRYIRTARVQLTARQFVDVCQASGALADVRAEFFAQRSPDRILDGLEWLYARTGEGAFA